jgi:uncharacterized protein involved in outer membrane biogenesis
MATTAVNSRKRRWLIGGLVVVALIATPIIALALFDWNNARGWISQKVKDRTGRDLVIAGNLDVRPFSFHPKVHVEQLTFSNAPWGDPQPFIAADTLDFSFSLWSLLRGPIVFPEITLGEGSVLLQRDKEGRRNWILDPDKEKTGEDPIVQRVTVNKGKLAVKDVLTNTDATVNVQSTSDPTYPLALGAQGRVKGIGLKAKGASGGLLTLMDDAAPYPLKLAGTVGQARFSLDGTITGLSALSKIDARLSIAGSDLARLGDAVHISLPETAPYKLTGRLTRDADFWRFSEFRGTVGESDLGGEFSVDMATKRPTLGGKLNSKLIDIKDLGGFVGAAPGKATPKAPGKGLPANTINLEKLRRVDAHVTLTAAQFKNPALPLDKLNAKLDLVDGVFKLTPIEFGVAGGTMSSRVTVNAQQQKLAVDIDSAFKQLRIGRLIPRAELVEKSLGAINGRAQWKGHGNSAAAVLGASNGRFDLMSGGGQVSNLLLEFAGADIAEIVKFWMGGDQQVELRCGVVAFNVKDGLMTSEVFVIDTDDTYFGGAGTVSLRDETLDLTITPLPKDFSPVSLRGPLHVRGTFANPTFGLDKGRLTLRAGAALLLGLINPLAAIIPLIETGPGKDAPCGELVKSLEARIKTPANVPQKKPAQVGRKSVTQESVQSVSR